MKEWCPHATMELVKCQKEFNDLNDKLKRFIEEVKYHKDNGHEELSSSWILNQLEIK